MELKQVTIIGTGLIGGSLGLAFKKLEKPPMVAGFSRTVESLKKAKTSGAIDAYSENLEEAVKDADIVFICTPVSKIVSIAREAAGFMKKGAVITDVGSTKSSIVQSIESSLPEGVLFIGGHPMAGSENYGIDNAAPDLFKGSHYILTPTENTDTQAFQTLHGLLTTIGANVIAINADKHDRIVANLSHLPHLAASSLVNLVDKAESHKENWLAIAAGGFKDTTRIAASNPDLWLDICLENKDAILKALDEYTKILECMAKLIRKEDKEALKKKLQSARDMRISMVGAAEKEFGQFRDLFVQVSDKPGVISDITLTIGELGLNIENIEIVPIGENSANLRISLIGASEAQNAAEALRQKGYAVDIKTLF